MIRGLYEVHEVAQLTGLAPRTLRNYTYCTTLVRGRDFTVLRRYAFGRANHRIVFTKRGVDRIAARDFLRIHPVNRRVTSDILARMAAEAATVRLGTPTSIEGRLRRKQARIIALAQYLESHPCPSLACACLCHRFPRAGNQVASRTEETPTAQD